MTKLEIIVGSTRPGRVGLPVGQWIEAAAREHGGFSDVELVDLAEVNLPFFDEPKHPRFGEYVHQHTKDWSAKVSEADAVVFVTPEYNTGPNAALKNAIDFLSREWAYLAVGIVSYGGVSAGTRAAQQLKEVLQVQRMSVVPDTVSIPFVQQFLSEDKKIVPNEVMVGAANTMFDELVRVTDSLSALRKGR